MSNFNDYTIGWLCAIGTEQLAAKALLDEEHDWPDSVSPRDDNAYTLGKLGKHNIVIAGLPLGEYGITAVANASKDMLRSFPNIRIGLLVGVAGGVPGKHDIRLGDVVVGITNGQGAVFQYDFGKAIQEQDFQPTMFLNQSPPLLRTTAGRLQTHHRLHGHQLQQTIDGILNKYPKLQEEFQRPDRSADRLYLSNVVHPPANNDSCEITCDNSMLVPRKQRAMNQDEPVIHYGLIASGSQLIKDALIRDRLAEKDVLCFEMEAAGVMNYFPCLVIRGICDYSDSHKNKHWQGYAALAAAAYAKDLLRGISPSNVEAEKRLATTISSIKENVDQLVDVNLQSRNMAILNWLTPFNQSAQQADYLHRRQEGTGKWLLDSDKFQAWIHSKKQMLFCPGMPGAGKTILTSTVVDHLQSKFQKDSKIGIAYFFFDYKRQDEQTIDGVLASFLRQLAASQHSLPDAVHELYEKHNTQAIQIRPPTEKLIQVLKSVMMLYSRTFIIIDALDECNSADCTRQSIIKHIFQLQSETEANIFITSRPEVSEVFLKIPTIEIRANGEDVERYLKDSMIHLPRFVQTNPQLQDEIVHSILQAVDGMFLIAHLYLHSLKGKINYNQVIDALQNLEKGSTAYEKIYDDTMNRINSQCEEEKILATSVLSWLFLAKRPMRVAELQHALAVKPNESDFDRRNMSDIETMTSVCAGLVTIDDESNIIRLVHYTTQEYFQQTSKTWFREARTKSTKTCITYLSYRAFEFREGDSRDDVVSRVGRYPFYSYASLYWGDHARGASNSNNEVMAFLTDADRIWSYHEILTHVQWQEERSLLSDLKQQTTGLHLATWFGLTKAVDLLLQHNNKTYIEAGNDSGQTALHIATKCGHEDIAELLLDKKSEIEAVDTRGDTPLHTALVNHEEHMLPLLLKNNADTEARNCSADTLLHAVAQGGYKDKTIRRLLKKGADIEALSREDQTPLHVAAAYGNAGCIEIFLDWGADREAIDENGDTPLHLAAYNGEMDAVHVLLKKNANFHATNNRGRTPLHEAVFSDDCMLPGGRNEDHEMSVQRLLQYHVDIEATDVDGKTPLHLAAGTGHQKAAKLLLDHGARVNVTDLHGKRPIDYAQERYHSGENDSWDLVQLLLIKGAVLHVPISLGHAEYVAPDIKTESGESVFTKVAVRAPDTKIEDLDSRISKRPRLRSLGEDVEMTGMGMFES
ncbi:Ankyrin-3 [Trichoderma lentiforme]|uniref:Ankyrin-3 n=1 Tax=Trichoderma lentiforme TaxID=1567552 RepID=A0A9P4XKC0_9HYPO|nr:Ankyrin-3 [Trichoderma lentiforme]